jgi:hypothetical protein
MSVNCPGRVNKAMKIRTTTTPFEYILVLSEPYPTSEIVIRMK